MWHVCVAIGYRSCQIKGRGGAQADFISLRANLFGKNPGECGRNTSLDVTLAYLKGKDAESEEAQEHANSSSLALYA